MPAAPEGDVDVTSGDAVADEHEGPRLPFVPALDGLRGLAVVAVLLYHAGFRWARGGHLGVTSFFVLSGFLITGLLLTERERTGRIDLKEFWSRRARRLVPAAVLGVAVIAAYVAFGADRSSGGAVGDGIAALTWVANWRFIVDGTSYADVLEGPSPFQHYWSLAVEEQLYVLLPLVVIACLGFGARTRRWLLGAVLVAGIAASTAAVFALHEPGTPPLRAYYGTDARVAEPLLGALLALLLVGRSGLRRLGPWAVRLTGGTALLALAGLAGLMTVLGTHEPRLYDGGFLAAATATALVILGATQPGTTIAWALSAAPLRALGRISYGVYLFHWPIFLYYTPERTGLDAWPLLAVRVAATLCVALASYWLVELPVRLRRLPRRIGPLGWANASVGVAAVLVAAATFAPAPADVFLGDDVASAAPPPPVAPAAGAPSPAAAAAPAPEVVTARAGPAQAAGAGRPAPGPTGAAGAPAQAPSPTPAHQTPPQTAPPTTQPAPAVRPVRVAVVGDSLAANLGRGLEAWAGKRSDVVVYNLAISACPLSRGGRRRWPTGEEKAIKAECEWWADPGSERSLKLAEFDADVFVVEDGFNELPDRKRDEWGRWYRPGDPEFTEWLLSEYQELMTRAMRGSPAVVLNAACANWAKVGQGWETQVDADARVLAINNTVYQQDRLGSQAVVGDLYSELCPNGYSDDVEGVENGRPDGMHLSNEAAERLAQRWLGPLVLSTARGRA